MAAKKRTTALVLGSGGARGIAHIGVIKALEEKNINVDIVTGTSIGAFIGGLYAKGMNSSEMEKVVKSIDMLTLAKIFIPKLFASGLIDNKRVFDFIKELTGDVKIENLNIPFACVSTDIITGEEVIINKGNLAEAVMASIAIPNLLQPFFYNGRFLIDGGLCNPLPISIALDMKAQKVIAVDVSPNPKRFTKKIKTKKTEEIKDFVKKLPSYLNGLLNDYKLLDTNLLDDIIKETPMEDKINFPSFINMFLQTLSISTHNLMTQHLLKAKPDLLISPKIEDYDLLEFYKGSEILKCGYDAAKKALHQFNM